MEEKKEIMPFENSFFTEAGNDRPYFKCSLQGDPGSGKTYTMAKIAIGLHKKIGSTKPIFMIDTEIGSKWLLPLFEKAGIKLLVRKTKSLTDVEQAMKMCQEGQSDILMIDSITHIHEHFLDSYKKKLNRQNFQFQDYGIIKPAWREHFTNPLVNSECHVLFSGRLKDIYENELDEHGKRQIYKSGKTMQADKNLGYEPDMLLYMEIMEEILDKNEKKISRQATVLKDRSDLIDGKTFENPTFENFEPVIDLLLKDPVSKQQVDVGDDQKLFKTEENKWEYVNKKNIALEKIKVEFDKYCPGMSTDAKTKKIELSEKVFLTGSWTEIEGFSLAILDQGLEDLKKAIIADAKAKEKEIVGVEKLPKKVAPKKATAKKA